MGQKNPRRAPTQTYRDNLAIAERDFARFRTDPRGYSEDHEAAREAAGAPDTPGRGME